MKPFDFILAADVMESDVNALVKTLRRLLKPSGTIVMFASPHSNCMDSFLSAAKPVFDRIEVTRHYDDEVTRALHGMSCFPKMVRMHRSEALIPRASTSSAPCIERSNSARPSSRPSSDHCKEGHQAAADISTNDGCEEHQQSSANADDSLECAERKRKRWRDILVARAHRRSSARTAANPAAADASEECS